MADCRIAAPARGGILSAAEVRTPGGSRASADELGNSDPSIAPTTSGDKPDDASGLAHFDDRKGLARIKAELALRGYAILETSHGYLIGRWGWSRIAPDLRACGAFLRQIGGPR